MNKYILMTGLALVLAAPAAHAEYTGNGAISSSSTSGATGSTLGAKTEAEDAKQRLKEHWDKLKESQASNWDKLEAERRAHWHVPNLLHKTSGGDTAATGSTATGGEGEQGAGGETPAAASDGDGVRASRWEKFKENHQGQKDAAESHLESAKDKAHSSIQNFKDEHKDTISNAKEKAAQWKDDHQDTIDALKDKFHLHHKTE